MASPVHSSPTIATTAAATGPSKKRHSAELKSVKPTRTPAGPRAIRRALESALRKVTGKSASPETVDMLSAHVAHETALGQRMYNYNFGGIKGAAPDGGTARLRTTEVLRGRTVKVRDGFRAYGTLEDGAEDYVRLLSGRFKDAFEAAERGDVDGFAHMLKQRGYYTASETQYTSALRSHHGGWQAPEHTQMQGDGRVWIGDGSMRGAEFNAAAGRYQALGPATLDVIRAIDDATARATLLGESPSVDPEEMNNQRDMDLRSYESRRSEK